MRKSTTRHYSGFTLIELIVVIVITVILAVFVDVIFFDTTRENVLAAAYKIQADLRYAQTLAYSSHNNCGIAFSSASNSYTVFENNNPADPAIDPSTRNDFVVAFDLLDSFKGVEITSALFGASEIIMFDSFGVPYDGASGNALAADGAVELNNQSQVIVKPETGLVAVQE